MFLAGIPADLKKLGFLAFRVLTHGDPVHIVRASRDGVIRRITRPSGA